LQESQLTELGESKVELTTSGNESSDTFIMDSFSRGQDSFLVLAQKKNQLVVMLTLIKTES
jgi:hypothetical protein